MQRQIDVPARAVLLLLGILVLWRTRESGVSASWSAALIIYATTFLATFAYWFGSNKGRDGGRAGAFVAYTSYFIDALWAGLLIWRDGGMGSPLYIVLVLLALKAIALGTVLPAAVWLPFTFGPIYAIALWIASGSLAFLVDSGFLARYAILGVWLIGVVVVARALARRTQQALALDAALIEQQQALEQKTEVLQKTATDLGDRVLELRSLQEVAKALATTLRTEETLQLVVQTLYEVTGTSHCAVALIDRDSVQASRDGAALDGIALSGDGRANTFRLALGTEPATLEALRQGRPLRSSADDGIARLLGDHPFLVTALVSRGHSIGAVYVAEHAAAAERTADGWSGPDSRNGAPADGTVGLNASEQLLASFAYFAATTLENARLYQDAWEKRRELEAVLVGIGDGVVVAGTDLSLVLMNPVAREMLGLDSDPPGGAPLSQYLAAPAFVGLLTDTLAQRQDQVRELELPARGGKNEPAEAGQLRTYGAVASPVLGSSGEVSGVVAVLRDITAQKELERMKSNFLSVISHELRTPLHSIKGFVEIILMGKTGPVTDIQEDFLKTVRAQTTVLQRMIDDLLELSRMEAGRVRLALSQVSLQMITQSVVAKLTPLAEEAGLSLSIDIPGDLPNIDGDRMRLEQVVTNLVENAIKFSPAGGVVTVSAATVDDRIRLTVSDTGIGIPLEEQEKVFDRFYQVDGSERRAYRGTGLGLSICRHIVERHSGRIWAESDGIAGQGTRFQVELPIDLALVEPPVIDFMSPASR